MKLVFSTTMLFFIRTTLSTKISLLLMLCFSQQVFAGSFPNDDSIRTVSTKQNTQELLFRENIVQQALHEYDRWRNGIIIREQDSVAASILETYWNSVGKCFSPSNYRSPEWQESHPWSAVFTSYIIKQAGGADHFRYSETHADYILWAKNTTSKANPLFEVFEISDSMATWPKPGDILCKNREGKEYNLNNINSSSISHCDIVVEVDTLAKAVYTIGGNLNNTVAKRLVWLDDKGFIDKSANWLLLDEDFDNKEGSQKQYFAIIRLKDKNPAFTNNHSLGLHLK